MMNILIKNNYLFINVFLNVFIEKKNRKGKWYGILIYLSLIMFKFDVYCRILFLNVCYILNRYIIVNL